MKKAAFIFLVIAAASLLGPRLAPWDFDSSPNPAALRALPPLTEVPYFVRLDGSLIPIAGRNRHEPTKIDRSWEIDGDIVRFASDYRRLSLPLEELRRDENGAPLIINRRFYLGTDGLGRDLLSRLLAGAPHSLGIGVGGVIGAGLIALLIGIGGGIREGLLDETLSRLTEGMLAIPRLMLLMALAGFFSRDPFTLAIMLALTGWPALARLIRAQTRSLVRADFIAAAHAAGTPRARVVLRHLLPGLLPTVLIGAALRVGPFVLMEASLSFLGLGVPSPSVSWGSIVSDGQSLLLDAWWISTIPGILLATTVWAINFAVPPAWREEC